MTKKKRYKKPVLTIIKLDPEQALITQCYVGGFGWMEGLNCLRVIGPSPRWCSVAVRGAPQIGGESHSAQTAPS